MHGKVVEGSCSRFPYVATVTVRFLQNDFAKACLHTSFLIYSGVLTDTNTVCCDLNRNDKWVHIHRTCTGYTEVTATNTYAKASDFQISSEVTPSSAPKKKHAEQHTYGNVSIPGFAFDYDGCVYLPLPQMKRSTHDPVHQDIDYWISHLGRAPLAFRPGNTPLCWSS